MEQKSRWHVWLGVIVMIVLLGIVTLFIIIVTKNFQLETLLVFFAGSFPSLIYWSAQRRKEKQERENWILRDKKAYLIELVSIFDSFIQDKGSDEAKQRKLLKRFKSFRPALLIWGSPPVIKVWNEQKDISGDSMEGIRQAEKLFRAIRKELDHDDSQLPPGAIVATLVKPEEKKKVYEACKDEKNH